MNISACKTCYNCGSCYNICPHQAITVDEDGIFYTPRVNAERCTDCGICYQRCPANENRSGIGPLVAFAGWHRDPAVLRDSSSGGVFHGLAGAVLALGGVVYGAIYSEDCMEVVFASTDEAELAQMRKSKYVESLVCDSFRRIKEHLSQGRMVLFCGTPCQCAGLRAYLGKEEEKLICCDFACGGLPSHQMYRSYLKGLQKKYGAEVQTIDFRPKTHGWRRYAVLAIFSNGKAYNRLGTEDPYLRSFLYGKLTVRNNCLDCKFSDSHQSDLTIADFWLNENQPTLRNDSGVSLILCNTPKGCGVLESIRSEYYLEELNLLEASYNNKKTVTAATDRERHDMFVQLYQERGLDYAYQQAFPFSWKKALKSWLRRMIGRQSR